MSSLAPILIAAALLSPIDGDTFRRGEERIRIANIDAPETRGAKCDAERRLGFAARARLGQLLAGRDVKITVGDPADGRTKDRSGRTLATVTVGGLDIGDILVAEGLARPWEGHRRSWC